MPLSALGAKLVVVGNVSSSRLKKTNSAKSVSDAGWFQFKSMLESKSKQLGIEFKEVNEAFSTQTCSGCKSRTGPKGLAGLKVREWVCSCGAHHDRDINSAINILRSGQATPKGSPISTGKTGKASLTSGKARSVKTVLAQSLQH